MLKNPCILLSPKLSCDKKRHRSYCFTWRSYWRPNRTPPLYHRVHVVSSFTARPLFSSHKLPTLALCKKKIFRHIKLVVHVWSTKCRRNQKPIAVLCETNVLSLISQRLNNYYQIQKNATVRYSATGFSAAPTLGATKRALSWWRVIMHHRIFH